MKAIEKMFIEVLFLLFLNHTFSHVVDTLIIDWDTESTTQPPCTFNSLCTCSGSVPILGLVQCINVPLTTLPQLNTNKVFVLRLENNGLRALEGKCFRNTGMWKLQIRHNLITRIPDETFAGLEHSLRQLDLQNNQLYVFPREALKNLTRLQELDLTGNFILNLQKEDFIVLEKSLKSLILKGNALTKITHDAFSDFNNLKMLDISDNRLSHLSATSFHRGTSKLQQLFISHNALRVIPYGALLHLKSLSKVDLSHNRIVSTTSADDNLLEDDDYTVYYALLKMTGGLKLDSVILDENQIEILPQKSFRHFTMIHHLSLKGNPIKTILEDAFQGTHIQELNLQGCDLVNLMPDAFRGLHDYLYILDLSHNLIDGSTISTALMNMTSLVKISIEGNKQSYFLMKAFQNSKQTLQEIYLESASDKSMQSGFTVDSKAVGEFRQLQSFGISHFSVPSLLNEVLEDISPTVEKLILQGSNLQSLIGNPFKQTPRLKHLDLSSNQLEYLDDDVFTSIGRSLETLDMGSSFVPGMNLKPDAFNYLSNLRELDLSNNQLKIISSATFQSMKLLKSLNLQDNALHNLQQDTFSYDKLPNLNHLKLSFNQITVLGTHFLADHENLQYLLLNDNAIERINKGTFFNLKNIKYLDLEGNAITSIRKETFEELPRLQFLNLAYNHLRTLLLSAFDQVGTLSNLKIDVSHNQIYHLSSSDDSSTVSIKTLDFTHNNISSIDCTYFDPIKNSLIELHFGYNSLANITKCMFGDMPHLQFIDVHHNKIAIVESDSFENSQSLQVVSLSYNNLMSLPSALFSNHHSLRHLDMSNNNLDNLPDNFLGQTKLEHLKLSSNRISIFPITTLASVNFTLRYLDLSANNIRYLPHDSFHMLTNLQTLILSCNELKTIEGGMLNPLSKLNTLVLSNNPFGKVLYPFISPREAEKSQLEFLDLSNVSLLSTIPEIKYSNLLELNLSHNNIQFLPPTSLNNIQDLRRLDLSHNKLSTIPTRMWPTVSRLKSISLAYNPIQIVTNESFFGLNVLDELDICGLQAKTIQNGLFLPLTYLRTLRTNMYSTLRVAGTTNKFDLLQSISILGNLRSLHISSEDDTNHTLDHQFKLQSRTSVALPPALNAISINGRGFTSFASHSLILVQSRDLHLQITNTTLSKLSFENSLGRVRHLYLDVSHNSLATMTKLTNTEDRSGHGAFLQELTMSGNPWQCNCDLGWVEYWMRRWKQLKCRGTENQLVHIRQCKETIRRFRQTKCFDRNNKSLLDVMKEDLECGWNYSTSAAHSSNCMCIFILIIATVTEHFLICIFHLHSFVGKNYSIYMAVLILMYDYQHIN